MKLENKITEFEELKYDALQTLIYLTVNKPYNSNAIKECNQTYINYINKHDKLLCIKYNKK